MSKSVRGRKWHRFRAISVLVATVCLICTWLVFRAWTDEPSQITGEPSASQAHHSSAGTPVLASGANGAGGAAHAGIGANPTQDGPAASPAVSPADPVAPDEAHWANGELMPPLPRDAQARRAAIEQARSLAASAYMAGMGTEHTVGGPGAMAAQGHHVSTEDPLPYVEPYVDPLEQTGMRTTNLKLPDTFKADPAAIRGIDPATGAPLNPGQQDDAPRSALTSSLIQSFHGIDQTIWAPPDCDLGVGPNQVVVAVNSSFTFYDKCGNSLYTNTFSTFLGDGSNQLFDPKVVYDAWDGRWIMLVLARNSTSKTSSAVLMVSDDNNPLGSWCWWYLDMTTDGGNSTLFWADYPDVETSPDGIVITTNQFDWPDPTIPGDKAVFQYAKVRSLSKTQVYGAGCPGVSWWDFWNLTNASGSSKAFTLRVSGMHSWGGNHWLINSFSGGGSHLTLWAVSGAPLTPTLTKWDIGVSTYDNPPPMLQANGLYLDMGDARLLNANYYAGSLWTGHTRRVNWGETSDRSAIAVFQINPGSRTLNYEQHFGATGFYYAYPAVDFDDSFRGIVSFARGGPTESPGTRYASLPVGGPWGGSVALQAGLADYTGSINAGTLADPKRWGDYYGCARDAFDPNTLWFFGEFGSNSPAGSWDTQVGSASNVGSPLMSVTPTTGMSSTGFAGGPFSPPSATYTVQNTGGSALTWNLINLPAWLSATSTGGQLQAGGSAVVTVSINSNANSLAAGTYSSTFSFENCLQGGTTGRVWQLTVGTPGDCDGSKIALYPSTPPDFNSTNSVSQSRGLYVTAMKDFSICSVGFDADFTPALPVTVTASIYEANGTTRGALVASASHVAVAGGATTHWVPISATLSACSDYDIVMSFNSTSASWNWWDDRTGVLPSNAGGAIRVRDGESNGNASNFALPPISIIGSATAPSQISDISAPSVPVNPSTNANQERGVYITPDRTTRLCSVGWLADLPGGGTLTARVYEASGTTRGALVAGGTLPVAFTFPPNARWWDIPVNATLNEGQDYDIAVSFGAVNNWDWWDETAIPTPFTVDAFQIRDAELNGSTSNVALMHFRYKWDDGAGGAPFDLAKQGGAIPPPNTTGFDNSEYGMFVRSDITQQVYSLGWMADVPAGEKIAAVVYSATGTTRGALLSSGSVVSTSGGMRWHDIPVAVTMAAGQNYDIAISFQTVTEWRFWNDTTGLPYTAYGTMAVLDGEAGGEAVFSALIHMRYNGCDELSTPVVDSGPQRVPMFIATPAPNPISDSATLRFALEQAGPVRINVYDVAGRRVATLLDADRPAGWNMIHMNGRNLASGVYFIRMKSGTRSVSRKFVVTH